MKRSSRAAARARGCVLALALLAGTYQARPQGTIVYVNTPQPIYYGPLPSSRDLDLNGDGIVDYTLTSDGNTIDLVPRNLNAIISILEPPPDIGGLVVPLSQGRTISSSLDPSWVWYGAHTDPAGASTIISCMNIGCIGYWQNVNGYAGLQLNVNNQTYYGWLRIQNSGIQAGEILDWAYQTATDAPIFAGEVPEPNASALLLLGAATHALCSKRWKRINR